MSKDEEPAATSFANPRKTGWLYKHGGSGLSSHWRKRWFVADSNYLFYYKTPSDKKPVGILCLQDYAACCKSKDCKKPYSFVLERDIQATPDHDDGKNYLLYTDSEKDMNEWIKAMTDEMKGPLRQPSEKTRQKIEKIDQQALEEVSKAVSEGPKLVHLTAERPKLKNRRPPLKKYATYHEDDSKEEISEDDSPALSRKKPDSVQLKSSVKLKQPLLQPTKPTEDEALLKEPQESAIPLKQPLLPKGGSKIAIKPPEENEGTKVKPLPLLPKKALSHSPENQNISTEGEVSEQEGETDLSGQVEPKIKPLPPPVLKKGDIALSGESQIVAENKLPAATPNTDASAEAVLSTQATKAKPLPPSPKKKGTLMSIENQADQPQTTDTKSSEPIEAGNNFDHEGTLKNLNGQVEPKIKPLPPPVLKKGDIALSGESQTVAENKLSAPTPTTDVSAEAVLSTQATKAKPLPPSPKKKGTLMSIENQADQPQTTDTKSSEPIKAGNNSDHERTPKDDYKMKDEECVLEVQLSSTSEELLCQSDDSHTELTVSPASSNGKSDEINSTSNETGNKPKPKPRKRGGKELQTAANQHEVLPPEPLHPGMEIGSTETRKATEVLLDNLDQNKIIPVVHSKLSEVAAVMGNENQVFSNSEIATGTIGPEEKPEANPPYPVDSQIIHGTEELKLDGSTFSFTISLLNPDPQVTLPLTPIDQNQEHFEFCSGDKTETMIQACDEEKGGVTSVDASIPNCVLPELPKGTSDCAVVTDKQEKNAEALFDEAAIRSNSNATLSFPMEHDSLGYAVIKKDTKGSVLPDETENREHPPNAASNVKEMAPRIREPYRMYETVDIVPSNKTQSQTIVPPDTVPLTLKQAKEVLRLAQAVRAEAEEMKKEAQRELELAKRERLDAEILKKNATEILRIAKEKLHRVQQ